MNDIRRRRFLRICGEFRPLHEDVCGTLTHEPCTTVDFLEYAEIFKAGVKTSFKKMEVDDEPEGGIIF